MSDLAFLEKNRVKNGDRAVPERYWSDETFGFNGMFRFFIESKPIRCLASDGGGWQHVSVTVEGETKPPPWGLMCKIKELFWHDEDVVCQYHPAKSHYINNHPGCLHLWRPTLAALPTPPDYMVGIKL